MPLFFKVKIQWLHVFVIRRIKLVLFLIKNLAGLQQQYQDNLTGTDVQRELYEQTMDTSEHSGLPSTSQRAGDFQGLQSFSPLSRKDNLCQIPWHRGEFPIGKQQPASPACNELQQRVPLTQGNGTSSLCDTQHHFSAVLQIQLRYLRSHLPPTLLQSLFFKN